MKPCSIQCITLLRRSASDTMKDTNKESSLDNSIATIYSTTAAYCIIRIVDQDISTHRSIDASITKQYQIFLRFASIAALIDHRSKLSFKLSVFLQSQQRSYVSAAQLTNVEIETLRGADRAACPGYPRAGVVN